MLVFDLLTVMDLLTVLDELGVRIRHAGLKKEYGSTRSGGTFSVSGADLDWRFDVR